MQSCGGQSAHGGFAAGTRTLHANFAALHAVLIAGVAGGIQRSLLCGVWRSLARAFEADRTRRRPAQRAAVGVGDGDLRVVEGRSDVNDAVRHDTLLALLL